MKFVEPEFRKEAFHCPLCGVFSHMDWEVLRNDGYSTMNHEAKCSHCNKSSLWRVKDFGVTHTEGELIFPDFGAAPLPEEDMPEDVKKDYIEAARIFAKSRRGSAALLRLGLQKLCKHLGENGKNINTDIRELSNKNILPPMVIKVADTVRITGNNAVHPGEMNDEDFDHVASKMFELINFIVKKGISEPKEIENLYLRTPEGPRNSAEKSDAKSKASI